MSSFSDSALSIAIRSGAQQLDAGAHDYDALLELVGDARFVLLGEATHGTHEFYQERARITQRLIAEMGFHAVAIEADWPDAYRLNRYVRGQGTDRSAREALGGFQRFPEWMWRNRDMADFVEWQRHHNSVQPSQSGLYGLDLYSMFTSISEVLDYLDKVDPEAATHARKRYGCFDHYHADSQRYGYTAGTGLSSSCEDAVVAQLQDLHLRAVDYLQRDGQDASDALYYAQQNARLVKNAEAYYRTMFHGRVASWNLRDRHMVETLDGLAVHLSRQVGTPARIVVWAHNSHLGDARATEVSRVGEWNVGQLVRERYGDAACLVGMTTYHGWVTAASEWDGLAERKRVRPGLEGSYEAAFHDTGIGRFMLDLKGQVKAAQALEEARLERAIGVIYLPRSERASHYFLAQLPRQFDAVLHFDETDALEPLERGSGSAGGEAPETYPVGL